MIEIQGDTQLGIDKANVESIKTSTILKYAGLAIFKQDKLIGFLTEEESRSFNFLNDNIKSTVEVISCPEEGKLTIEIKKNQQLRLRENLKTIRPKLMFVLI